MTKPHLVARYMEGFFRQYLGALRGVSDKTILAYRDALKLLLCFAADLLGREVDELAIEHLDDKVIVAFLDHVEKKRNCCVRTRNARLAAVKSAPSTVSVRRRPFAHSVRAAARPVLIKLIVTSVPVSWSRMVFMV